jgi:hypothetical protein
METDSYYEIGSSHRICQDYCFSTQEDKIAYAILSDGCSSSKDSTIGACLLPILAKNIILYLKDRMVIDSSSYISTFSNILTNKLSNMLNLLDISSNVFDATLLICIIEKDSFICFGWGDGFFISKNKDDHILIKNISYYDEAPYYPSYDVDLSRRLTYQAMYADKGFIQRFTTCLDKSGNYLFSNNTEINNCMSPILIANGEKEDIKSITICSDGIKTYYHKDSNEKKIDESFIIPKMLDYKNTIGEFVNRRMLRLKKEMHENNIMHSDDISCSTIIL